MINLLVMTFAELVKRWRQKHELTRADASRRLEVPYRTLEDWEAGKREPKGIALRLLIKLFGK
jgi:DNA-binding transcriptional regulator YiaG